MQPVRRFIPDPAQRLDATIGGAAAPFGGTVAAVAAVAILWRFWLTGISPLDDPFELAFGVVALLASVFAGVWSIGALLGALAAPRRRTATLLLDEPAKVGGALRAGLRLSWRMRPDESAIAVLECSVTEEAAGGGWASVPAHRWWWERVIDGGVGGQGTEKPLELAFAIPSDAPPSGTYEIVNGRDRHIVWTLTVSLEPEGKALNFVVPVSAAAGGPLRLADSVKPDEVPPGGNRPAGSRIRRRSRDAGVTEVLFPRTGSTRPLATWVSVSAPLWAVLPWLAWRDGRDLAWSVAAMLGIAAIINGLPLLLLIQVRRLRLSPDGVTVERALLPARRYHLREIRGATVRALSPGGRPLYVCLERTAGDSVPVSRCSSVAEAHWLAGELQRALRAASQERTALLAGGS